jgi:hypothetical protein
VVHLAGHRPEAVHLEHQPLEDRHPCHRVARHELPGFLGQVQEDGPGLEDADRFGPRALGVDDRRDLVVRAELQEGRVELLAPGDVDDLHAVGQAHLLERQADLAAIGVSKAWSSMVMRQAQWAFRAGWLVTASVRLRGYS